MSQNNDMDRIIMSSEIMQIQKTEIILEWRFLSKGHVTIPLYNFVQNLRLYSSFQLHSERPYYDLGGKFKRAQTMRPSSSTLVQKIRKILQWL